MIFVIKYFWIFFITRFLSGKITTIIRI